MQAFDTQIDRKGGSSVNESTLLDALKVFSPDLYSPDFQEGNVLHFAAQLNFTQLIQQVLTQGYTDLLWVEDNDSWYPVEGAVEEGNYGAATILLRAMMKTKGAGKTLVYGTPTMSQILLCKCLIFFLQGRQPIQAYG